MNQQDGNHTRCGICEANDYELLSERVQFNMPYFVVICRQCGFIYLNPQPSREVLNQFYKNDYATYYGEPVGYNNKGYTQRGYKIYEFVKGYVDRVASCVEIGAGGGGNLVGLSENYDIDSTNLAAIEPGGRNNESLKLCQIPIIGEFYDLESFDLKDYDLVVLSHVLEHLYSPRSVLSKLYEETSDHVWVYISVPCIKAYLKKENKEDYKPLEDYWYRLVHLSYFHEYNLEDLLTHAGWAIVKKELDDSGELKVLVSKSKNREELTFRNAYQDHLSDIRQYKNRTNYKDIVIFGTSRLGKTALFLLEGKYNILHLCDNDPSKWGKTINGLTIISPDELMRLYSSSECQIIIASMYFKEIDEQLLKMGIENRSIFDIHYNLRMM